MQNTEVEKDTVVEKNSVADDKGNRVVHVAAAVIRRPDGHIFLARRPADKHQGGLWEFPGGKVEPGEAVTEALARELQEELGIYPLQQEPLIRIRHDYRDKSVLLDVWTVREFSGVPHGREGQAVQWVREDRLSEFDFPVANRPIVSAARLPRNYMITGAFTDTQELLARVQSAIEAGVSLIQFRAPWLSQDEYLSVAQQLSMVCRKNDVVFIVKGELSLLDNPVCDGLHLTSNQLRELAESGWCFTGSKWLAVSCHNQQELEMAAVVGAGFAVLSPVAVTRSHPDASPLGQDLAAELTEKATVPVFWLGGMDGASLPLAIAAGAQGVAGISAFGKIGF